MTCCIIGQRQRMYTVTESGGDVNDMLYYWAETEKTCCIIGQRQRRMETCFIIQ